MKNYYSKGKWKSQGDTGTQRGGDVISRTLHGIMAFPCKDLV